VKNVLYDLAPAIVLAMTMLQVAVGHLRPTVFDAIRDLFRAFGWHGFPSLPFLFLTPVLLRLAGYALVILVLILLLRDRRPASHEIDESANDAPNASVGVESAVEEENRPGMSTGEETPVRDQDEEEVAALRRRICDLERRIAEMEEKDQG